jgi:holo-ACP synthase CitX
MIFYAVLMMQDHVTINQREISGSADGYAAYLIVSEEADFVTSSCIRAEEELTFGMIAYLDVMDRTGLQIGREALGFPPRKCFVCDRQAAFCTSRRLHSDTEPADSVGLLMQEIRSDLGL